MNALHSASRRLLIASVAALLAPTFHLRAQTWDGGGANDNFTTAANWNPNTVPANNGTADLIFTGSTRPNPVVNSNFSVDTLTLDNVAGANFSIGSSGGSVLTIGAGGISNASPTRTLTFTTPVTFAGASSISATTLVNFTGAVDLGGSVTVNATANVDLDAVTGSGGLVKNGTGTMNIQSAGTQNYDITVNNGIVDLDAAMTFSSSSVIAVNGGALDVSGTILDGATLTRSATGAITGFSLTARNSATVAITGAFTFPSGTTYTIEDSGTTFSSGDFELNNNGTFRLIDGADMTVAGDFGIANDGTGGTLFVSGAGTTLSAGGLSHSLGLNGPATVTFTDGASAEFTSDTVRIAQNAGSSANVLVSGGAQVTAGNFEISPFSTSGPATVTVTGPGSKMITTFNIAEFEIGDVAGTNPAVVNVENGGELDLNGPLLIEASGTLNLNGGIVSLNNNQPFIINNGGAFNFTSGRINFGEPLGIAGPGTDVLGSNVVLGPGQEITVQSFDATTVGTGGALVIDGGLLQTGSLTRTGGVIDFRRGRLAIVGSSGLTVGESGPLGQNVTVPTGATLEVSRAAVDANASLIVDGGTLAAEFSPVTNSGSFLIDRGVAIMGTLANNAGAQIVVAGTLETTGAMSNNIGARVELAGATGRILGTDTLTNHGLLAGHGTIAKPVTNSITGEIRADLGKTLLFTGAFNPNAGELNLQGGTIHVAGSMTNSAGSFISGRGALRTGGLTNDGQMAFSGGVTDIRGDVTINAGARVVTGGAGSVTTFFDDVVHNGQEIFTGLGASTVFFGEQSGAGPFTGTGTVYYIGDLRPGNSTAIVSYGGDVVFSATATLALEIGGVQPGESDHLDVAGTLLADGTLTLALSDGFLPESGDVFDLFDVDAFTGEFDLIQPPPLPDGLTWDVGELSTTGAVMVIPEPAAATMAILALPLLTLRRRRNAAEEPPHSTLSAPIFTEWAPSSHCWFGTGSFVVIESGTLLEPLRGSGAHRSCMRRRMKSGVALWNGAALR